MSSSLAIAHHYPPPAAEFDPDPPAGTRVSEADYWQHYYEHENAYEWNNGILEVKPVSDVLTFQIYQWLLKLLGFYLETHHNAQLIALEFGFRLSLPGKVAIRKPDLGLVLNNNPVPLQDLDRSYQGIFDLCVEALSDSTPAEIQRDTEQKRREYEAAGVPEYYILHHKPRWQLFYRRNALGRYEPMPAPDGILRSDVAPGFQFRLADLARRPEPDDMIEDPVYAPFVLPKWQADRTAWSRDRVAWDRDRQALFAERQAREQAEQQFAVAERQLVAAEQHAAIAQQKAAAAEQLAQQERLEKQALLAELARLRGAS
jgi:hypothetical protein